jgi:hypothetical protein
MNLAFGCAKTLISIQAHEQKQEQKQTGILMA